MKLQPLPPLNSLVAFEAAAHHLSFTVAARELNVTQGAISRQVRLLEDYLGTALFTRTTREINLTATGSQYRKRARYAATDRPEPRREYAIGKARSQVTVVTSTAMASLWLLPLVSEFQRQNEEIDLRIIATDQVSDFPGWTVTWRCITAAHAEKHESHAVIQRRDFPTVCSPAYLAQHPGIETLKQLGGCTWLWLEDQHRDWIGWKEWFQRLGYQAPEPRRRININSYSMLIQSALAGQGIALAWSGLLSNHLQTGNLVRPTQAILRTDAQFCLLEPQGRAPKQTKRQPLPPVADGASGGEQSTFDGPGDLADFHIHGDARREDLHPSLVEDLDRDNLVAQKSASRFRYRRQSHGWRSWPWPSTDGHAFGNPARAAGDGYLGHHPTPPVLPRCTTRSRERTPGDW